MVLCARDPLTGEDHRNKTITAPAGAVLIVDSVFAFRSEYNDCWEYRIWLDVDPELAIRRGIFRDAAMEGFEEAARLHRDRYHASEMIYLAEVRPQSAADVIIDNRDFAQPRILSRAIPSRHTARAAPGAVRRLRCSCLGCSHCVPAVLGGGPCLRSAVSELASRTCAAGGKLRA